MLMEMHHFNLQICYLLLVHDHVKPGKQLDTTVCSEGWNGQIINSNWTIIPKAIWGFCTAGLWLVDSTAVPLVLSPSCESQMAKYTDILDLIISSSSPETHLKGCPSFTSVRQVVWEPNSPACHLCNALFIPQYGWQI